MDKNFEDKIARLAFGELTEAEAAEVRAMANEQADSARALETYEALRSDLRRLRDVPPDQLSKERLQNAILAQGLKPKPVRRGFPWAWASTAAVAAMAFLFVIQANQLKVGPAENPPDEAIQVAMNTPDVLNDEDKGDLGRTLQNLKSQLEEQPTAIEPSLAVAVEPVARKRRPVRHAKVFAGRMADSMMLATQKTVAPIENKPDETLVLIQTEPDADTGAKAAVEVHQTNDVIVSS